MLRSGLLLTEDTTESLQLYHKALEMISKKLTDPDEHTSDSVIGSMSGFLTHDVSGPLFCVLAVLTDSIKVYN